MKFKINKLNILYNQSPENSNNIYERQESTENPDNNQEFTENVSKLDQINISVNNINAMLDRINDAWNNHEIVCSFLNESIDDGAKFSIVKDGEWKEQIWLVIDNSQEDADNLLSNIEKSIKENNWEYYFDKNDNNKKDSWEFSVNKEWNISWVDIKEEEKRTYANIDEWFIWEYFQEWDRFIYEVWEQGDKWAAILRQVVTLWNELWINTTDYSNIKDDISNLYVDTSWDSVVFSKHKNENSEKVMDLEVLINWDIIKWFDALNYKVNPWDKIDISSLAIWLNSQSLNVNNEVEQSIGEVETLDSFDKNWWSFYTSAGAEHWDLPDGKEIVYQKTNWSNIHTNWKNIQINAKNLSDIENNTQNKNENKFSNSFVVEWKSWEQKYIVIWEIPEDSNFTSNYINKDNYNLVDFENSWVEAWEASYDKNGNMSIKEVWDKNVHEFIRTNNFEDSWKSLNNPIYLDSKEGEYIFERTLNWKEDNLSFNKEWLNNLEFQEKDWKESVTLKENNELKEIFWESFKDVDSIFEQIKWEEKSMFIEFNDLKSEDNNIDITLKFEKWEHGELKITKLNEQEDKVIGKWEDLSKLDINEIEKRCDFIKSIDDNKIETNPINNLWYSSFIIEQKKDAIIFKNEENTFELRGQNKLKTEEDFVNFFNNQYLNVIFSASNPKNMRKDISDVSDYIYYIENIWDIKTNKEYVKKNILSWENKKNWDQLIKESIDNA